MTTLKITRRHTNTKAIVDKPSTSKKRLDLLSFWLINKKNEVSLLSLNKYLLLAWQHFRI